MSKLRFAVLGTGMIVRRAHLPALLEDKRVEIATIYGRNREAAAALATQFGIGSIAGSLEQAFQAGNLDAVVIALPNHLHRQAADLAAASGLHILMEKPLADRIADAESMVEAAARANVAFAVNLPQRHRPSLSKMKRTVDEGRIGKIEAVEIRMLRRSGIPGFGTWFTQKATAGGGVLADLGPHVVDLALWLSQSTSATVVEASIWGSHGRYGRGLGDWTAHRAIEDPAAQFDVEDRASFTLRSNTGAKLRCELAWAYAGPDENRVSIIGDQGGLDYWPEACGDLQPLTFYDAHLQPQLVALGGDHGDLSSAWQRSVSAFVDAIAGPRSLPDGREALTVHRIINQLYEAA